MRSKFLLLVLGAMVLAGCVPGFLTARPADSLNESPDVTLVGQLVKSEAGFLLSKDDGTNVELDSKEVKLDDYEATGVVVTGQYSGTTLFVSKIRSK